MTKFEPSTIMTSWHGNLSHNTSLFVGLSTTGKGVAFPPKKLEIENSDSPFVVNLDKFLNKQWICRERLYGVTVMTLKSRHSSDIGVNHKRKN